MSPIRRFLQGLRGSKHPHNHHGHHHHKGRVLGTLSAPDPVSNIRHREYVLPENATPEELRFKKLQIEIQEFHHEFWTKNNTKFQQYKAKFIEEHGGKDKVTAEQLSKFYKDYLEENRKIHMAYNLKWWKLNAGLLMPAFQANISRFVNRL
eukprot:Colp12_sorted_trinity150504_noHs@21317